MTAILVTTNQSDKIITKLAQQTRSQYLCSHSNELLYIKLFDILHCIHPNVLHIVFINSINCVCKRYLFVWFRSCTISRPSRSLASAFSWPVPGLKPVLAISLLVLLLLLVPAWVQIQLLVHVQHRSNHVPINNWITNVIW